MPPSSESPSLYLKVHPHPFFLVQLKATEKLPQNVLDRISDPLSGSDFLSITRTAEEISIVSDFRIDSGIEPATQWCCICVTGPMNLGMCALLSSALAWRHQRGTRDAYRIMYDGQGSRGS